ncbi:hypothetical protein V6N13_085627 [Hibiscus sabdariffa]|uniref:Uncharacterized protein n=1 Tax=Hibiscus sabdariffa TaxID=183260 RepID=A0ABR2D3W3_9ROSI
MGKPLFIFLLLVSLLLSETGARVLKDSKLQSVNGSKNMMSGPSPGVGYRYDNVQTIGLEQSDSSVGHEYHKVGVNGVEKSGPSPGEGHK